ncbi:hypothetical protein UlMin_029529 [Ulmus minor]
MIASKAVQRAAAEAAINSVGLGYDLTVDLSLKLCKRSSDIDPRLIIIDNDHFRQVDLPGGISIPNVSNSIKCDKGERIRIDSDVLSFQQMSEQFNMELSLSGKIPTGQFNSAFEFTGSWQNDAASAKGLAFDGVSIIVYDIALEKSQVILRDHVKQAVPTSWNPAALAWFIQKYGTHIIVGVKMGGEDIIYVKQQHSSPLQPADLQKKLEDMADKIFQGASGQNGNSEISSEIEQPQDAKFMRKRKGGSLSRNVPHDEWAQTVHFEPDVVSMSLVPISSLLAGVHGSGYMSHAINLYLRYKPPIEELHPFLEFQLPRQWAPVFGELPLRPQKKPQSGESLQFSFMSPKLHVNTTPVCVLNRPVTGVRLFLEGKRSNRLAIHLQHLSSAPMMLQVQEDAKYNVSYLCSDPRYYTKVDGRFFSRVCTAAVEANDDLSVVTGAHFEVGRSGTKKVLFLRLHFSRVTSAKALRQIKWDFSPFLTEKPGIITTLISTHFSTAQKPPPKPSDVNINSAVYPDGPPLPSHPPKLQKFVDTTEITRGPQDFPGYWVVSGARLFVANGKISLLVKYSLLDFILTNED